ncbi:MAG: hypothetical protein DRQ44_05145 [Gammaproteobacteria bacterium]|nr:MAG: hypothetical protein DRQ44_05145 [Gammaproteobacteria bacterium]
MLVDILRLRMIATELLRSYFSMSGCIVASLCFIASIAISASVYAEEPPRKLIVGTERDFYPFADVDDEGAPQGFSVDLFRAVAKKMGIEFEFQIETWKEILNAIEDKQVDILPIVIHSERRDRFLDFSITHIVEHAITIKRHDGQSINSIQDLRGKDVVVMDTDGTHMYMDTHVPEARLFLVPTVSDALQSLAAGSHDYAVVPRTVGLVKIHNLGLDDQLQTTGPFMTAYSRGFSFGVQDGDRETLAILNQGLNLVKDSGEYAQIYNHWFGEIDPRSSAETLKSQLLYGGLGVLLVAMIAAIWLITLRRLVNQRTEEVKLRREATEAAEEINIVLQNKIEELAAYDHTIAHHLKTSLAASARFLEILSKFKADTLSEEQYQLTTQALSTLNMGKEAVDALLMLSMVTNEQIEATPIDMETLVHHALQQLQGEKVRTQASVNLPKEWHRALGYAPWVGEVWLNFLSNAFKYSNIPVQLELGSTKKNSGTICYWVRDNGQPLTDEEREQLFVPFVRLHPEQSLGHGLGLIIAKRIIEKLGGSVGVNSLQEKGNEFFFILPVAR